MKRLAGILAVSAALAITPVPAHAVTGPLQVRMEVNPSLTHHVIFRPAVLAETRPAPVVVFAGGGCRNAGARFRNLLSELASHGYVIVSLGEIGDPDWDANLDNEPDYKGRPTKTDVSQIAYAVNWLRRENQREGSAFKGRLDTGKLALMGQSCGGVQAIDQALHIPGVSTLVVLNSGLFDNDRQMGGSTVKRADLGKLTMPTMILLGGKDEVAYDNGQANFDLMTNAPVFLASADYGHRATYFDPDGGLYGTIIRDWLDWRLKGDAKAGGTFLGDDCRLCRDQQWSVRRRSLPAK